MSFNGLRFKTAALLLTGAIALGGCSAGDVQFEGKVFEAVGLSGQQARRSDPKVGQRAPLVLPPKADLPPPGERAIASQDMSWPDDPELRRKREVSALQAKRQKYCREIGRNEYSPFYDEKKAKYCASLLSNTFNNTFGRKEETDTQ